MRCSCYCCLNKNRSCEWSFITIERRWSSHLDSQQIDISLGPSTTFYELVTTSWVLSGWKSTLLLVSKMATEAKRILSSLNSNSGSSHKDATGKYREILEKILKFKDADVAEGLNTFVEAGKFLFLFKSLQDRLFSLENFHATTGFVIFIRLIRSEKYKL